MTQRVTITLFQCVLVLSGIAGCAFEDASVGHTGATLNGTDTAIGPRNAIENETGAVARGLISGNAATLVDATEGRDHFPMPTQMREFASRADAIAFMASELGMNEIVYDQQQVPTGIRGTYAQHGVTYYYEPSGTRWIVTDPILAFIAGVQGKVKIAGQESCWDPDGDCSAARASYLAPDGQFTAAPRQTYQCGTNGVCATFSSFYVHTWFPWFWARHGTNVRLNVLALPSTRLRAEGGFRYPLPWGGYDFGPYPSVQNQAQWSIETAAWSAWYESIEFQADAACGWGSVSDPDVSASKRTADGPAADVCPT